jgi:hypothetical protein
MRTGSRSSIDKNDLTSLSMNLDYVPTPQTSIRAWTRIAVEATVVHKAVPLLAVHVRNGRRWRRNKQNEHKHKKHPFAHDFSI